MQLTYTQVTISEEGRITFPPRFGPEMLQYFRSKTVEVTVKPQGRKRSNDQNAYYWGVVVDMICEAMRQDGNPDLLPSEVHEFLKFRYLAIQKIEPGSGEEIYRIGKSTTKLKTWEFCGYIDNCINFAAQHLHTIIPPPHEVRKEYKFLDIMQDNESYEAYIERIQGYCNEIVEIENLRAYYKQVPEFKTNPEIVAMFTKRADELKKNIR